MAFSEAVLREAWERTGGQCECNRRTHKHFYTPCGRSLKWNQRGMVAEGGWQAREIDSFSGDKALNCLVICMECYDAIR